MNRSIGTRRTRAAFESRPEWRRPLRSPSWPPAVAPVAAAAKAGSAPGVTKDTIKLGTTQPLTGPAAPGYSKISKAMTAWFEHVNAEGGIHGRKVELIVEDDGYNPTNTAAKTRKLVLQDKVFALVGALGTPDAQLGARLRPAEQDPGPDGRLRQPLVEPAGQVPVHVRLAAGLHP